MKMDVKTQLHEGMKIAPIDNQEKEYTLIKSSEDNKMYALHNTEILKLNDIDEDELDSKWICTNLSAFQDELRCVEFESGKIVSFDDFCVYSLADSFSTRYSDDYTEIGMKEVQMTREDYMIKKGFTYEFKCREIIADRYQKQTTEP